MFRSISSRYSEPVWPHAMRAVTRAEYAYTLDGRELEWRIQVAEEMADEGFPEAALYYLRFWAYSLARIPMVWQSALEGKDIPFLRPERRVKLALQELCPDVLEHLRTILGGEVPLDQVHSGLENSIKWRALAVGPARSRGTHPQDVKQWRPYQTQ